MKVAAQLAAPRPGATAHALLPVVTRAARELASKQAVGHKPRDPIVRDVERHLAALEGLLGDRAWLVGDAIPLADLAVATELNALEYAHEGAERL